MSNRLFVKLRTFFGLASNTSGKRQAGSDAVEQEQPEKKHRRLTDYLNIDRQKAIESILEENRFLNIDFVEEVRRWRLRAAGPPALIPIENMSRRKPKQDVDDILAKFEPSACSRSAARMPQISESTAACENYPRRLVSRRKKGNVPDRLPINEIVKSKAASEPTPICTFDGDGSDAGAGTTVAKNTTTNFKPVVNEDIHVEPVNSIQKLLEKSVYMKSDWIESMETKWLELEKNHREMFRQTEDELSILEENRRAAEKNVALNMRTAAVGRRSPSSGKGKKKNAAKRSEEFKPLKKKQQDLVEEAVHGPPHELISSISRIDITRADICTLLSSKWLNDVVINAYMKLIVQRSERRSGDLPSVHAMDTFFCTRLVESGYLKVCRWTRRVDIFSKDIILVPVNLENAHWYLVAIHFRKRSIMCYDSFGRDNSDTLDTLEQYLKDESLDKRKIPLDTRKFTIGNATNVPHQRNGNDCGVFTCMFAEYITRNKAITFKQKHIPHFRRKMIYEIVCSELCQ